MDEDQRSARANDEVEDDDDVEAHLRTGRAASEEQADETEGDDFELHQRTGR